MAAPQRRQWSRPLVERPARRRPGERNGSGRASRRAPNQVWRRRTQFKRTGLVLVVPLLLMLGSVYAHTAASELGGEAAQLEEEKAIAESEGERLEVRVTELEEPGRIRSLARDNLGMQDPKGKDLETYGSDGEDVANGGGEQNKGAGE